MGSLALSAAAGAQGSPYIPLDDPRLRLLEHLIARGDVEDPSPHVRPLLERDVLNALRSAARDTTTASGKMAGQLLRAWQLPLSDAGWWRVQANAGGQIYSQARREHLQPLPIDNVDIQPYVDGGAAAGQGPLVGAVRLAYEPRIADDPDYRRVGLGGGSWKDRGRFVEAYIAGQVGWLGLHSGQVQRNWGPAGLVGIPISNYAYPRTDVGLFIGNRKLRYQMLRAPLYDGTGPGIGRRWFSAARLDWQVLKGLDVALWESSILVRSRSRSIDAAVVNPFYVATFGRWFKLGDDYNTIVGSDVTWRPIPRMMLQAQLAIDDMSNYGPNPYPDRYGLGLLAAGAVGASMSWRASYAMNSSLAYTSPDRVKSFTQSGVGIGRNFIDNDLYTISLTMPLHANWLIVPEAQVLRQGEGNVERPWPPADSATATPLLWIGTRRDTYQVGVGVVGYMRAPAGDIKLSAQAGYQLSSNAFHVGGKSESRFVGRLQLTYGWRTGGEDKDPRDEFVTPSTAERADLNRRPRD
jgi:hypothetical protein